MKSHWLVLLALPWLAARAADFSCDLKGPKGEPIGDVVVALIPLDQPVPAAPASAQVEIVQADQEFSPYVTVVQAGTRVVFPNHDTVQHHVYSLSKAKKFELPLYTPGSEESLVFDVAGLVTIGCNIHDWMISHVVVVPTPWFAKSNPEGHAAVAAPPGRYRLELWHPRSPALQSREIVLPDAPMRQEFTLALKPDRRVRRAPAGKAGGY